MFTPKIVYAIFVEAAAVSHDCILWMQPTTYHLLGVKVKTQLTFFTNMWYRTRLVKILTIFFTF